MANTKEKHHIWSSDINEELGTDEEIKEQFKEFLEINNLPPEDIEEEEKMYDYADETVRDYLEDLRMEIKSHEDKHGEKFYLVLADIGRWDGRYAGGRVIKGLWNTLNKTMDDYTKFYQDGKTLKVSTANHDGSSSFEIYELTKRGEHWYNNSNDLSWRNICEHLHDTKCYTKNCSIFKEVYGW